MEATLDIKSSRGSIFHLESREQTAIGPPTRAVKRSQRSVASKMSTGRRSELDMDGAREKLIAQVKKHPFWSNKAAKRMRLLDVCERQVYIYELTSFCERRDLEWRYEPYRGSGLATMGLALGIGAPPVRPRADQTTPFIPAQTPIQQLVGQRNPLPSPPLGIGGPLQPGPRLFASLNQPSGRREKQENSNLPQQAQRNEVYKNRRFTFATLDTGRQRRLETGTCRRRDSPIQRSYSNCAIPSQQSTARHLAIDSQDELDHNIASLANASSSSPTMDATSLTERPLPSTDDVWSFEVPEQVRPQTFTAGVYTSELPQSSFVKRCHGCSGRGRLKCSSCYGVGYEVCISCSGKGTMRSLGFSSSQAFGAGALSSSNHSSNVTGGARGGRHEPGGIAHSSGLGAWQSELCHLCHGEGQKRCWVCAGRAYRTCATCAGAGQLRCYLRLNITWLNHRDESVINNNDQIIPLERLKLCSGLLLIEQEAERVQPLESSFTLYADDLYDITSNAKQSRLDYGSDPAGKPRNISPDDASSSQQSVSQTLPHVQHNKSILSQMLDADELNQLQAISLKLLDRHQSSYTKEERLIRQRQKVTQVGCFIVNWEFKRRRGHFVIYGDERKVYIAKYPFKSICSIS